MKKVVVAVVLALVALIVLVSLETQNGEPIPREESSASDVATSPVGAREDQVRFPSNARLPLLSGPGSLASCELEILVVGENDAEAVPGVGVDILPRTGRDEALEILRGVTDSAGRFVCHLEPGPHHVSLDRGTSIDVDLQPGDSRKVTLRVATGVDVPGIVVDPGGAPVSGAEIWSYRANGTPFRYAGAYRIAVSAEDGTFALANAGGQWVGARKRGHGPSVLHLIAGDVQDDNLRLRLGVSAAMMRGVVKSDGVPVGDAVVQLQRKRPRVLHDFGRFQQEYSDREFRASAEGRFELVDLRPGEATLVVRAPHHAPRAVDIQLMAGQTVEVSLELEAGASLGGIVRDPDGHPIEGAILSATRNDARFITRTTRQGRFELSGLPPGEVAIRVAHDEFCGTEYRWQLVPEEEADCVVVLEPLGHLRGRVIGPSGAGVAGFIVQARLSRYRRGFGASFTDDKGRIDTAGIRSATTDEGGRFDVGVMPEQGYYLDTRHREQFLDIDGEPLGEFVAPRDDIAIALRAEDISTAFVRGRLVDPQGEPIRGAWFQVTDGRRVGTVGQNTPGTIPGDGSFRIGPLPARHFTIKVYPEDKRFPPFETEDFELSPNQVLELGDVMVPLRTRLVFRLMYPDGTPIQDALIQLRGSTGSADLMIFSFDSSGRLDQAVLPGSYEMTIYGGDFASRRENVEMLPGEERVRDFVLPRAVPRRIRCSLPDGEARAELTIRDLDSTIVFEMTLSTEDHLPHSWSPRLAPGTYRGCPNPCWI